MDRHTREDIMRAIDRATRVNALIERGAMRVTLDAVDVRALCDDIFIIGGFALGASPLEEEPERENTR